jgi:hypothetical protein
LETLTDFRALDMILHANLVERTFATASRRSL